MLHRQATRLNSEDCLGSCILGEWRNDGTEQCDDGSDEDNLDYDLDDEYGDADFDDIVSKFDLDEFKNSIVMPTQSTLRIKVIIDKNTLEF